MINKSIENDFEDIFQRICKEIGIKSIRQLADIIGRKQPTISAAKSKNVFSAEWAYIIAKKYDLLTEWIMTGKGPKSLNSIDKIQEDLIFSEIKEWIGETSGKGSSDWFENQFVRCFPDFLRWKEKKEFRIVAPSEQPEKKIA